jgi:hypothetical protein
VFAILSNYISCKEEESSLSKTAMRYPSDQNLVDVELSSVKVIKETIPTMEFLIFLKKK